MLTCVVRIKWSDARFITQTAGKRRICSNSRLRSGRVRIRQRGSSGKITVARNN